jgi:hypothetical protein
MNQGSSPKFEMLRKVTKRWSLVSLLVLSALPKAEAAEIYKFYTGVRQLGMGGAYTAVVNDETSLLTNPAGLGKIRDTTLTVVDPEVSLGSKNTSAATASTAAKVFSMGGLQETLQNARDTHWHAKAQVFPSLVTTNFGIGVHAKWQTDAEITTTPNNFRLDYTNDYAVALGYCLRMFDGIVKLGVAGRAVNRVEIHKDLDPAITNLSVESQAREGGGVAADVGLILTAPITYLPSLAVVVRDAGNTAYTLSNGMLYSTTERPQATTQTIDAGFSISPILSNNVRMQWTGEYHDVSTAGVEQDQMRRVHLGTEINFSDFFFLRAGLNQRYWTTGLEFATERFQLQAATYGEEIGTADKPREDRRFVGKFSFRF